MSRIKEFNLPDLGEGLTEGEILKWLVHVGDTVTQNQPIVEVETAKAAVEIPAKWAGQVTTIFHSEGATVEVGAPIIAIDTDPGAGPIPTDGPVASPSRVTVLATDAAGEGERTPVLVGYGPKTAAAKRRPRAVQPSGQAGAPATAGQPAPRPAPTEPPALVPGAPLAVAPTTVPAGKAASEIAGVRSGTPVLAKPPVRKLARDLGVDLTGLTGTGPHGSISRDDVHAAGASAVDPWLAGASGIGGAAGGGRERRIPVKGVRRLTAESMVASAFTAPHVTEFLTIDVTRSVRALERLRAQREWRDVRLSPLLLVAKAVLSALRRHPLVNSTWAGDEIIVKDYVNLGIAAATERGLIVPNIKDAGALSLRALADALTALVETAKAGRTSPADMTGGTFTITNVGVFGVDTGTPILPPGEAAILALGAIRPMPWVHRGELAVREVTTLAISFDHRIIDGELGSRFLRDVGDFLTDPQTALLAWG